MEWWLIALCHATIWTASVWCTVCSELSHAATIVTNMKQKNRLAIHGPDIVEFIHVEKFIQALKYLAYDSFARCWRTMKKGRASERDSIFDVFCHTQWKVSVLLVLLHVIYHLCHLPIELEQQQRLLVQQEVQHLDVIALSPTLEQLSMLEQQKGMGILCNERKV